MAKKILNIAIETTDELDNFVKVYSGFNKIVENEALKLLIKIGFENNATDYVDALYKGAQIEQKRLIELKSLLELKKATELPIAPANEVEKNLSALVAKTQDDELAKKLINERHTL